MTISIDATNFTHFDRKKKSVKLRGMFLHFSLKANTVNIVFNLKRIGQQFINISLYNAQKIRSKSRIPTFEDKYKLFKGSLNKSWEMKWNKINTCTGRIKLLSY